MIRALQQRFKNGVIANAAAPSLISSASLSHLSSRTLSIAPVSSIVRSSIKATKPHPIGNMYLSRQSFHGSAIHPKSIDDVHVTFESGSPDNTKTDQSTPNSSNNDSSASSGGTCSQGIPNVEEDEEDDMEEMFVVADPVLGLGNIQEWGGPRRGGSLHEPTRFGDWERKGRCTDF